MSGRTPTDLRALAQRAAPSASLPSPWIEIGVADDPVCAGVLAAAKRSGNAYAAVTAAKAADMVRRKLPGAAVAVFDRDLICGCGDGPPQEMSLRLVRDSAGAVLSYDDVFSAHPDAIRHAEREAYGGPVLADLDVDTQEAIQSLVWVAQDWGSPLDPIWEKLVETGPGGTVEVMYLGDLWTLAIDDTIAFAATLPVIAAP